MNSVYRLYSAFAPLPSLDVEATTTIDLQDWNDSALYRRAMGPTVSWRQ